MSDDRLDILEMADLQTDLEIIQYENIEARADQLIDDFKGGL
jgi:hypothetical protein